MCEASASARSVNGLARQSRSIAQDAAFRYTFATNSAMTPRAIVLSASPSMLRKRPGCSFTSWLNNCRERIFFGRVATYAPRNCCQERIDFS